MPGRTAFPHDDERFDCDVKRLETLWRRLHPGDVEPWPNAAGVAAWLHTAAG